MILYRDSTDAGSDSDNYVRRQPLRERISGPGKSGQPAYLWEAHLEGAVLREAVGLTQGQLDVAFGDGRMLLPIGLTRPAHWQAVSSDNAE